MQISDNKALILLDITIQIVKNLRKVCKDFFICWKIDWGNKNIEKNKQISKKKVNRSGNIFFI